MEKKQKNQESDNSAVPRQDQGEKLGGTCLSRMARLVPDAIFYCCTCCILRKES